APREYRGFRKEGGGMMAEAQNSDRQQQKPEPTAETLVEYIEWLAEHPEATATLAQCLAEEAGLRPLLFARYQQDAVSARMIAARAAKVLKFNLDELLTEFRRMSEPKENELPTQANGAAHADADGLSYQETTAGITWHRPVRDGEIPVRLTNFTAHIINNVYEDDGVETRRAYEIVARMGERSATVKVTDKEFPLMAWAAE